MSSLSARGRDRFGKFVVVPLLERAKLNKLVMAGQPCDVTSAVNKIELKTHTVKVAAPIWAINA